MIPTESAFNNPTSISPQICIGENSKTFFKITVDEERGALLAHISSRAYNGFPGTTWSMGIDHFLMPPPSIAVNGGRPF